MRKPFQGVWNIVRFNWHYYVLSIAALITLGAFRGYCETTLRAILDILAMLIIAVTLFSLVVSCYIYDLSGLYKLSWLNDLPNIERAKIVNIHAGFDETSSLLKSKYPDAKLLVFDFYDPAQHTEVSLRRARKAYPPFPGTQQVRTNHLPLSGNSADQIFAIFSAHEIRNRDERILFFKELRRALTAGGQIIVTEHLRDEANFLAYNFGFFHFHSKKSWINIFQAAGLGVSRQIKITPFITTFILDKNGTAS